MTTKEPDFKTPESKKEYEIDAAKYWRNISDTSPKNHSEKIAADDPRVIDPHLPSREAQYKMEQYYEKGYTKTSRSGAFTNKPNASAAIFPNGLRFASDFIDEECTPGVYQPQQERPVIKEQTRHVDTPRSTATIDVCMDCLKPVDLSKASEIICGLTIPLPIKLGQPDFEKLSAMGLEPGDIVNYFVHMTCHKAAEKLGLDATPLVLVKHGQLTNEDDVRVANKHGFALQLHNGSETTLGQWEMLKRTERMKEQLEDYLINCDKDSYIYRSNREKNKEQ